MPLTFANEGQQAIIKKITGYDKTRNHLMNLGFVEGAQVTVVSLVGGDFIVKVADIRIALSRQLANRILI